VRKLRPRLLVLSGPLKDFHHPLVEGEVTIGREASNGIAIIDPSVSRSIARSWLETESSSARFGQPQWNLG